MEGPALSTRLREDNAGRFEAMQTHRLVRDLGRAGTLPEAAVQRWLASLRGLAEDMLPVLGHALVKAPGAAQRRRVAVALHQIAEPRLDVLERIAPAPLRPEGGIGDALGEIARLGGYAEIVVVLLALDWSEAANMARLAAEPGAEPALAPWVALQSGEAVAAHVAWLRLEADREGAALDERGRARLSALFGRALALAAAFHDAPYSEAA